jgi:hypothetical protein
MLVGILTIEQKDELLGVELQYGWYFNPIQDANSDWIITTTEMYGNTNPDFTWVSTLPLIEWVPPII